MFFQFSTSAAQKIGKQVAASYKKLDAVREGMRALLVSSGINKSSLSCGNINLPVLRPVLKNICAIASTSHDVSTGLNKSQWKL